VLTRKLHKTLLVMLLKHVYSSFLSFCHYWSQNSSKTSWFFLPLMLIFANSRLTSSLHLYPDIILDLSCSDIVSFGKSETPLSLSFTVSKMRHWNKKISKVFACPKTLYFLSKYEKSGLLSFIPSSTMIRY
jgi:hypothetical protein